MLYQWRGKEEPLGSSIYTARSLTIDTLEEVEEGSFTATGSLDTMDYIENCGGPQRWEANGSTCPHGVVEWQVSPADVFWKDRDGNPMFTLVAEFDRAIVAFVAAKLNGFLPRRAEADGPIIDTVATYSGPMVEYDGPCVCEQIATANTETPFPWDELTQGGQFPEHCFKCSCGRTWFETDTREGKRWFPVNDEAAWEMIVAGNGEPSAPLAFIEGGFELVETVRARGLIPLG